MKRQENGSKRTAAALGLMLLISAFSFPQPATPEGQPRSGNRERRRLEHRLVLAERTVSYLGELYEVRLRSRHLQP